MFFLIHTCLKLFKMILKIGGSFLYDQLHGLILMRSIILPKLPLCKTTTAMAEKNNANIGCEKQIWDAVCELWGHIPAADYHKSTLSY